MNARFLIIILSVLLCTSIGHAQHQEVSDSLTRELQEVVVTAKQPATKLVGSTLVSTIPGTNLANLGFALDVHVQLPMIKMNDNSVSVVGKTKSKFLLTASLCAMSRSYHSSFLLTSRKWNC